MAKKIYYNQDDKLEADPTTGHKGPPIRIIDEFDGIEKPSLIIIFLLKNNLKTMSWVTNIATKPNTGLILFPIFLILLRNYIFCPSILIKCISAGCLCFILYCCIDFPTRTPACLILFSVLVGLSLKYTRLSFSK